jgi:hypothetical protein
LLCRKTDALGGIHGPSTTPAPSLVRPTKHQRPWTRFAAGRSTRELLTPVYDASDWLHPTRDDLMDDLRAGKSIDAPAEEIRAVAKDEGYHLDGSVEEVLTTWWEEVRD